MSHKEPIMKLWPRIVLFAGLGILAAYSGAQDASAYKVIVHPSNSTAQLSRLKIGEMFLKKAPRWADGIPVMPVEPPAKTPMRQRFTLEIYGKQVIAISAYWQQMIFSGKGIPPPEKSTDVDVVAYVRDTPGAIGYVWSGTDTSGVKVVSVSE
jgi:ABC-type phosphate transport system substrate-binding protein